MTDKTSRMIAFVAASLAVSLTALILLTSTGMMMASTHRYFCPSGGSGEWDVLANWYETYSGGNCSVAAASLPTAESKVMITAGKTCNVNVNNAVADRIIVESTGVLNIDTGSSGPGNERVLTVDGTTNSTSTVNGTLNLQGAYSKLKFITSDQTLGGSGYVVGLDDAAEIIISDGKTLTNQGKVSGKLKITPDLNATNTMFRNEGTVHANTTGTLLVNTHEISDNETALWRVSNSVSAVLRWNPTSTTIPELFGNFEVLKGTLDVDGVGFQTTGTLLFTEGVIDVDPVNSSRSAEFGAYNY